jgi:hypothetical protein
MLSPASEASTAAAEASAAAKSAKRCPSASIELLALESSPLAVLHVIVHSLHPL